MLFDPLEKQFDLPTALVELWNDDGRQMKRIGQKNEASLTLLVVERDATQRLRVVLLRSAVLRTSRYDRSAIPSPARRRDGATHECDVSAAAHDKERARLRRTQQPPEVVVTAVHDIERTRLRNQLIQHGRIGCFCRGNRHDARNVATQVHQRVQLDRRFLTLRVSPRKQRQTQLDHRGIERVDGVAPRPPPTARWAYSVRARRIRHLSEVVVDAPIAALVGIGQRAARNPVRKPAW